MKSLQLTVCLLLAGLSAHASWYWPFDAIGGTNQVRISELMEPATTNIDAAADFAADGKFKEAQECYRAALEALDRIEAENPERATTPEFATIRNKRAYVKASLGSMQLAEARENAKAVAVTDTTELEMKLSLKPWREFLPTYASLSNDYRIIAARIAYLETSEEAHRLLDAVRDPALQGFCVTNFTSMATNKPVLAARWKALDGAHASTLGAIERMRRFAKSADRKGGAQVFDVCRKDVRSSIEACQNAWPKLGESLETVNRNLDGIHNVLLEEGARQDFTPVVKLYADVLHGNEAVARGLAMTNGYLAVYTEMIDALNAGRWGHVYSGAVFRIERSWGGRTPEIPKKATDLGLVKNGGDTRPELESQVETHTKSERSRIEKLKRTDRRSRARSAVRAKAEKLLKKDPKSRKARLMLAGEDLRDGDMKAAKEKICKLLDEKPGDGAALNMRAAIEAAEGDLKAAEKTLDQAIHSNPRDYHGYYNMANVYLQKGNADSSRRYYETGRTFGGPKNREMELSFEK